MAPSVSIIQHGRRWKVTAPLAQLNDWPLQRQSSSALYLVSSDQGTVGGKESGRKKQTSWRQSLGLFLENGTETPASDTGARRENLTLKTAAVRLRCAKTRPSCGRIPLPSAMAMWSSACLQPSAVAHGEAVSCCFLLVRGEKCIDWHLRERVAKNGINADRNASKHVYFKRYWVYQQVGTQLENLIPHCLFTYSSLD